MSSGHSVTGLCVDCKVLLFFLLIVAGQRVGLREENSTPPGIRERAF
jgi:hypothetical protein